MYAWCDLCQYNGWVAEAELLFPFWEWSNFTGKVFLAPGVRLASRSVVSIAWWPPPLVIGVELTCLLEDPTFSLGMISGFTRGAMDLTYLVQNFV